MTRANEPPDRVELLRDKRAEHQRAADRIVAELGRWPLLRERNWFFHQLLNSDLDTYERVRPLWQQYRWYRRSARKLDREIGSAVHSSVVNESRYRELVTKAGREDQARRAVKRLRKSIRGAGRRLAQAAKGDSSRSTMRRDARRVERGLRRVHQRVGQLPSGLSHGTLDADVLAKLHLGFRNGDGPEERKKQYAELKAVLGSLERQANSIMREIGDRQRTIKAKQRRYQSEGKRRYDR